jgi:hypothetical protein
LEQQSELALHALPEVRHEPLSGSHLPPEQLPPQHSPWLAQAPLSETQVFPSHTPLLQANEQQSVGALQRLPVPRHRPTVETQVFSTESQMPEQHSFPAAHGLPVIPQAPTLASESAPPLSEDSPPQLATIQTKTKSQPSRVDMTILPRWTMGSQSAPHSALQSRDQRRQPGDAAAARREARAHRSARRLPRSASRSLE